MDLDDRIRGLISTVNLIETYLAELKLEIRELQSEEEEKAAAKRRIKAEEENNNTKTTKKTLVYTSGETIDIKDKVKFYKTNRTSGGIGTIDSITAGGRLRINRITPSGPQAIREPQTVTLIKKSK